MKLLISALVALTFSVVAQDRPATHHLIGLKQPLTGPGSGTAIEAARQFTAQTLPGVDLDSMYVDRQYTDAHNGVTHIVYRQRFQGIDVYNSAWMVNLDAQGQVLNAGGTLFGSPQGTAPSLANVVRAGNAALRAVNPRLAERNSNMFTSNAPAAKGAVRLTAVALPEDLEGRMVWYGMGGRVYAAWLFLVTDEDGVHRYASVVDDATGLSIARTPLTRFQSAKGQVFERESPYPNPKPGALLTEPPLLVDRSLQSFVGNATASPQGWVTGNQTIGNNAVVGENLLGVTFLTTPTITTAPDGNFSFPLVLGPGALPTVSYTDAINTNLFYWVNRAHDLHYAAGFTEAAGNFQLDNFGRGGVGGDPLYAYTHFGAQAANRASTINAFFTERGGADGSMPMIAMYIGHSGAGGFYTDGALDANVVVHEYTHGVSERLLPNGYDTFQVAAMGEAWSDFFGFEYTLPENADPNGSYVSGEYFDWTWGHGDFRSRPYTTNIDKNPLTYRDIGSVINFPEVHADGEIWMETLWEARANLIKQFGDAEGRRRIRLLVLDGMKFTPPEASMVDARDAILLADRTDFKGESQDQLWAAFAKRGFGVTAWSSSGDTVHVHPSFEVPSTKAKVEFYDKQFTIGEPLYVIVADSNYNGKSTVVQLTSNSGDLESLALQRTGPVLVGIIGTNINAVVRENNTLNVTPGDYADVYYNDFNTGDGGFSQISAGIPSAPPYYTTSLAPVFDTKGSETRVFSGQRVELPFTFPFFEKKYTSVYPMDQGILSFLDTLTSRCTDVPTFRTVPAIAPLWMQLTTNGGAQAAEGIYYSQPTPNSVRFRWAAETVTAFTSGSPVNFEVTLGDEGSILFNYGPGNTELGSAVTYAGCSGAVGSYFPVVGISPGHDTYAMAPYVRASWTNASGYRFDPPFGPGSDPKVTVESPGSGEHVQDVMTVSGIAYDEATFFSRAYILIDGRQFGSTTASVARTDFCNQQAVRGCPAVGYSLSFSTAALTPGPHTLQVRGINARGSIVNSNAVAFVVDPGQGRLPFGKVESPAAGAEVAGTLTVRGYAAINDLRIAGVDTLIDGVTFGPTNYGLTRNDICGTLTPRPLNCPTIGFSLSVNTRTGVPPLQDGLHTLQIRVRDETGRFTMLPDSTTQFTVKNGAFLPPVGVVDPLPNNGKVSGTVTISGYAYSPDSTIRYVGLIFDNEIVSLAETGVARPDVCANLPNVAACPNIGWKFDFDTHRLTNGNHVLSVQIQNARGDTTTLPSLGQPVVSLKVEN